MKQIRTSINRIEHNATKSIDPLLATKIREIRNTPAGGFTAFLRKSLNLCYAEVKKLAL